MSRSKGFFLPGWRRFLWYDRIHLLICHPATACRALRWSEDIGGYQSATFVAFGQALAGPVSDG
jgi:hypothetical protein